MDVTYGGEGATITSYVYDENNRFITVDRISLGKPDLELMLNRVDRRRRELDCQTEPLW